MLCELALFAIPAGLIFLGLRRVMRSKPDGAFISECRTSSHRHTVRLGCIIMFAVIWTGSFTYLGKTTPAPQAGPAFVKLPDYR